MEFENSQTSFATKGQHSDVAKQITAIWAGHVDKIFAKYTLQEESPAESRHRLCACKIVLVNKHAKELGINN